MKQRLVLVVAVGVFGCTSPAEAAPAGVKPPRPAVLPASGSPSTGDVLPIAQANNAFATDLYARLAAKEQGNLFFSPFSLSTALGMTYAGAGSTTAQEMAKALRFPKGDVHGGFRDLLAELAKVRDCELAIANRLWGQRDFSFKPAFLELTRSYGAPLERLDFAKSEEARVTINHWVEDQTRSRIRNLLPGGVINLNTKLVLTNAIYFKGAWQRPFKAAATSPAPFWTGTKEVEASLMKTQAGFAYAEDEGAQLVRLPYKGGLEMLVVLPREKNGLAALEKRLTAEWLSARLAGASSRPVMLFLPRFKAEYAFVANDALGKLGMRKAFSGSADFSGMTGSKGIYISAVVHKAFVEVNEEGTEAAAATAVVVSARSMHRPQEPVVFRADHPFVYLIRDPRTGAILFLGRVVDPSL